MKKDKEKGSITVEATLFIPLFLFAFLSIYNLIGFARVQLLMQYAVNQAAREVGQYSYLLEKTGILDELDKISSNAAQIKEDLEKIEKNLKAVQDAAENAAKGENVLENAVSAGKDIREIYEQTNDYVDNPQEFIKNIISMLETDAKDRISTYMISGIAKSCIQKQILAASGCKDLYTYLEKAGVTGLNLEKTAWCQDGSRDIKIIVDYNIVNKMPFFIMEPRHYRVCASTRIWAGVD